MWLWIYYLYQILILTNVLIELGMALVEERSIPAKDVLEFEWSPRANVISYWTPTVSNSPALVSIIKVPEKTEICSRYYLMPLFLFAVLN